MLKYSDLTPAQKKFITNGCGGKGGWVKPPNFLFKASCNKHDFYYWRGFEEKDRIFYDNSFYKFMKLDIIRERLWFKRQYYKVWAYTYYNMVRRFGSRYFYYGSAMKNLKYLNTEMRIKKKVL